VANAPAASCVMKTNTRVSHHRSTGFTRHSRTQWFTAYFVLSPATNSSCHRHPRIKVSSMPGWATSLRELDTSNGCQNDTSSPSAALRLGQRLRRAKRRSSACHSSAHGPYDPPCHPLTSPNAAASTASRPALVTTRDRPSVGRDGGSHGSDLGQARRKIFLQWRIDEALVCSRRCQPLVLVALRAGRTGRRVARLFPSSLRGANGSRLRRAR
jgi:hypothetical protein